MLWQTTTRTFDLSQRALIMGVLNVTADSFSDAGQFADPAAAIAHGVAMARAGAEIIDVGGESTRPGAESVAEEVEQGRVLPVITALATQVPDTIISIDTCKPAVARAALASGAAIINDVSGLRDPDMMEVARETGAGVIVGHMQGTPRDMQTAPRYGDVVSEIREFFRQTFARALTCGIQPLCLAFDPGLGFGKTVDHNLSLLQHLPALRVEDRPLVVGASRKSFLGKVLGSAEMGDRFWPTVAVTSFARERGANVLRVHDVAANVQALRMTEAIRG